MLKLHLIILIYRLRCNSEESIRISIVLVTENVEKKIVRVIRSRYNASESPTCNIIIF